MRWLIRKVAAVPYDTEPVSIVGPATEPVEVVPARAAERLADSTDAFLRAWGQGNPGGVALGASKLRDELASFRAGSSKEGQDG